MRLIVRGLRVISAHTTGVGVRSSRAWLLVLLPTLFAGLGAGGSSAPAVGRGDGVSVRVLLFHDPGPVVIEGDPIGQVELVAAPGGVRATGSPPVASRTSGGAGALEVRGRRVRGELRVIRTAEGLAVVNQLPLEAYLVGTLAGEMYAGWGEEVLRAQAVASRTYALHQSDRRRRELYDLEAGTASQVYVGVDAEGSSVRAAVEATRGEVLTHRGDLILAAFHSASGGRTASAEEVWGEPRSYLVSLPVEDESESPDTYWRVRVSGTTLGRALASLGHPVGEVSGAEVIRRSESGRVSEIRLAGERGSALISGRELRRALGESTVRSAMFEPRNGDGGDLVLVGSGSGHGVGMSQWGARAMARKGASYREILAAFYPGTQLVQLESVASGRERARAAAGSGEPVEVSISARVPAMTPAARGVEP
jgi:stage II sporulation protein D